MKRSDKIENWQDVYQSPFHLDKYGPYVWSKNGTMSLMFKEGVKKEDRQSIVDVINEDSDKKVKNNLSFEGCDFFIEGKYAFCVRGWGHLTGVGALNLSEEKALEIQDEFIRYIYKKLT